MSQSRRRRRAIQRPELDALIEQFRTADVLGLPSVQAMREALDEISRFHPVGPDIKCEPLTIGGIQAEWVRAPGASGEKVILYFHGGGYVIGSINSHRNLVANLSRSSGMSVLLLGYRLAPEAPFPAAVEDACAAYRWLLREGVKPEKIVLGGDSAGGGLAIAALVALRDVGERLPAAGICTSPWTDLEASGESYTTRAAQDPMCHQRGILRLAEIYLAGQNPRSPLASPLYADLRGLPPLLIHVGEAETLYDDSDRIAERAREAGVNVTLKEWKDMPHVFALFAPDFPESRQSVEELGRFAASHAA